jgi:hypothetical protein
LGGGFFGLSVLFVRLGCKHHLPENFWDWLVALAKIDGDIGWTKPHCLLGRVFPK